MAVVVHGCDDVDEDGEGQDVFHDDPIDDESPSVSESGILRQGKLKPIVQLSEH